MILHFVNLTRGAGLPEDILHLKQMEIFSQQSTGRLSPALVSVINLGKDAKKAAATEDPRAAGEQSRVTLVDLFKRTFGIIPGSEYLDPRLASLANREAVVRAVEEELQTIVFIDAKNGYDTYGRLLECVTNARARLHKEQLRRACTLLANKCTELKVLSLAARTEFRKHLDDLTVAVDKIYKDKERNLGGIDAIQKQFTDKCKAALARPKLAEHSLLATYVNEHNDPLLGPIEYIELFINRFLNKNFYNLVNWPILMAQEETLTV